MAKSKTKTPRKKRERAKQGFLPGTEPPHHKDLEQAAEVYYDRMLERKELSDLEDQAKDQLIDLMKQHNLLVYETLDGKMVTMTSTSNVRVKPKKGSSQDDNGEAEE